MNQGLENLQPYPFEKLKELLSGVTPPESKTGISLSIGEPRHDTPGFVIKALQDNLQLASRYPLTRGDATLREAISQWLVNRFSLQAASIDPAKHVIPVNGTREALFAICHCLVDTAQMGPLVVTGNPFYQIYEGAALLSGATPWYLNCTAENDFIADYDAVDESTWQRTQLLFLCSPNNPTGRVIGLETLQKLIRLSDEHDFVIASDECYSEIYLDEENPPVGLLEAAAKMGRHDYRNCLVFHSLSKRSNVPGLRSGFVAGDAGLVEQFYRYRTYHGCAMAPYTQVASTLAWQDEEHVQENRRLYREKFSSVVDILSPVLQVEKPAASFYLWPETPVADTEFARGLFKEEHVTVLPGSYLSREVDGINPGNKRLRIALVASKMECEEAATRIVNFTRTL